MPGYLPWHMLVKHVPQNKLLEPPSVLEDVGCGGWNRRQVLPSRHGVGSLPATRGEDKEEVWPPALAGGSAEPGAVSVRPADLQNIGSFIVFLKYHTYSPTYPGWRTEASRRCRDEDSKGNNFEAHHPDLKRRRRWLRYSERYHRRLPAPGCLEHSLSQNSWMILF